MAEGKQLVGGIGTYESYGFRVAQTTGQIAAATTGDLFQFRWNPPAGIVKRIRILEVRASAAITGSTAAGEVALEMFMARAWTADGSGGTTILTSGSNANQAKLRTAQQPTLVTARIATTTALTAGTRTLDTNPLGIIVAANPALTTSSAEIIPDTVLFDAMVGSYVMPLVLSQQEGFVIQTTAVPATTAMQVGITVLWAELDGGLTGG